MDFVITVLVRILEAVFIAGLLGSAVVLILTLIEDAKSLLPGDKKESASNLSQPRHPASDPVA